MSVQNDYPFSTLPDYLSPGLNLVFVGINPAVFAVQKGHYFARTTNRFWPAFSRSKLSARVRQTLGRDKLGPEDDGTLLQFGIGFTDVVKVPSRNVSELNAGLYEEWSPRLLEKLKTFQPTVACFHGVTGYRAFSRYVLGAKETVFALGPQRDIVGETRLFLVPNPSPANAHYIPADQVSWYDRLAEYLAEIGC